MNTKSIFSVLTVVLMGVSAQAQTAQAKKGGTGEVGSATEAVRDVFCGVTQGAFCESKAAMERRRKDCASFGISAQSCEKLDSETVKQMSLLTRARLATTESVDLLKKDKSLESDKLVFDVGFAERFTLPSSKTYWFAGESHVPVAQYYVNSETGVQSCKTMNGYPYQCERTRGNDVKDYTETVGRVNKDFLSGAEEFLRHDPTLWNQIMKDVTARNMEVTNLSIHHDGYHENGPKYKITIKDIRSGKKMTYNWMLDWYEFGPTSHAMAYQLKAAK